MSIDFIFICLMKENLSKLKKPKSGQNCGFFQKNPMGPTRLGPVQPTLIYLDIQNDLFIFIFLLLLYIVSNNVAPISTSSGTVYSGLLEIGFYVPLQYFKLRILLM